jgi:ADP-dependent NAD(P)H-hydrate dehydratase / NAD(P)H-hydrate epimerase
MTKIFSTKQTRELDAYTIANEPISSIDLMERACRAFVTWFVQRYDATRKVGVVCGTGNNGGDGLGIARMLQDWGYPIKVWIVKGNVPESADFKVNLDRIRGKLDITEITSESDQGLFGDRHIVIDAIFGSGLSRSPEGIYAQVIRCINKTEAIRIAVDIPSGLMADQPSSGEIVRADYTISFQLPKLVFMLPQSFPFTGSWETVDIGLKKECIRQVKTEYFYLTLKSVRKILKPRSRFDHKGVYGHALVVAGSYGKMGAAVLASRAALRAGAGLVTTHIPKCGYEIMQISVPEAMASIDSDQEKFTSPPVLENFSTIGLGPGLGKDSATASALMTLLKNFSRPVVVDADALNIISTDPEFLKNIPENSILTPHPKEFERLVGKWANDFERLEKQRNLAAEVKAIIVLKGANSSIATPSGEVYFNSTGNPGMATGGAGDVLTGILAGLVAQHYSPLEAALLGVFLHGLAGDIATQDKGTNGLIASDIVEHLPHAFSRLGMNKI